MEKIYLYMGRRDKRGLKILTIFSGNSLARTRIEDIKVLRLPSAVENSLVKITHDNRFLWEVWMESASNYTELKEKLRKRGYKNLPMRLDQMYHSITQTLNPDLKSFEKKPKKMLQRNKK